MKKINVAVVGLGYWGPNILRNFYRIPGVEIKWACDIDNKKLKGATKDYSKVKTTKNADDIFLDNSIDLVAIATPIKTHFKLAKSALSAHKNVLIEKPMTHSVKEANELITIANKVKKKIFVGHTFVYSEPIRYLKRVMEKKELGDIYFFDSTRINLGLFQEDSSVLWDLAPHDVSIITYLFSQKPISVMAIGSSFLRKNIEELVHLFIKLDGNIVCHIQLSWLSPVKIRSIVVAGSKKMITYDDINPTEKIKIYDKGVNFKKSQVSPFAPAYRSGDIVIPQITQKEALFTELSHFIDCLSNKKTPITGGKEGLEVVKIIEAAEKSLRTKKEVQINAS